MKQTLLDKQFDFFITFAQQSRSAGPPSFMGQNFSLPFHILVLCTFSQFQIPVFCSFLLHKFSID